MAYTTINKSSEHFNTKLYTGNSTDNHTISGVGFQPDFLWIKDRDRSGYNHRLQDSVRGSTKSLISNLTNTEQTNADAVKSFNSDGFVLGDDTGNGSFNGNSNFVSWNWKANGAGVANTDGDINSTVSANTTAGFSIVKYTGNGLNDQRIGHGLGARPTWWMIKRLNSADDWIVYHHGYASNWYDDSYMYLNTNNSIMGSVNTGTGNPTNSVFYIGNSDKTGKSGDDYIAYVFAEKTGYSKFGSYTGNGYANGPFVYTGFKPAWVLHKKVSAADDWNIFDNKRNPKNVVDKYLIPNNNGAEGSSTNRDFLSNGFRIRSSSSYVNLSGATFIYAAFAEAPLVGANNIPATAR